MASVGDLAAKYCHPEGFTDVCISGDGRFLITCGSESDIHIWKGLDDDEARTHGMEAMSGMSVAAYGNFVLVATDDCTVDQFTLGDIISKDCTVLKFSSSATHVVCSPDGKLIAASSCDMSIRMVDSSGGDKQQHSFTGHTAAVLSLALDPLRKYLASSSADGSCRIWCLDGQTCLHTESNVIPKANDFDTTTVFCRLAFCPEDGRVLAVPASDGVRIYSRDSWKLSCVLSHPTASEYSCVDFSPCGRYLACGCSDGSLLVWEWASRKLASEWRRVDEESAERRALKICAVKWFSEDGKRAPDVIFTDDAGYIGRVPDPLGAPGGVASDRQEPEKVPEKPALTDADFDFMGEMDMDEEMLLEALNRAETVDEKAPSQQLRSDEGHNGSVEDGVEDYTADDDVAARGAFDDDDEDGENVISIARIKAESGFLDDETRALMRKQRDEDEVSVASARTSSSVAVPRPPAPRPVEIWKPKLQPAFQPGSTPARFEHRFLKWNTAGIVTSYQNEKDLMIDVDFHNVGVHPPFHRDFVTDYNMADLTVEALALACDGNPEENKKSELFVEPLHGFGGKRGWTVEMDDEEDVLCVALGAGWVAVATSSRVLKVFTLGGVQTMLPVSLGGDVLCLAGFGDLIAIVFHRGIGDTGDQNLAYSIMNVKKRSLVKENGHFPLSPRSFLVWAGYTDEGSLCSVDSLGIVRLCPQTDRGLWYPILNLRADLLANSDHYFVIGISERRQMVRCILCKNSRFPLTVPRPTISTIPFKLPVSGFDVEQTFLLEEFWRSKMLSSCCANLTSQGHNVADDLAAADEKTRESSMKLFALSCKNDREMFALGLARLMPTQYLEYTIKYASRQRLRLLAEKIGEQLLQRKEEEENGDGDDDFGPQDTDVVDRRDLWSKAPERDQEDTRQAPALIEPPKFLRLKSKSSHGPKSSSRNFDDEYLEDSMDVATEKESPSNPFLAASVNARVRDAVLDTTKTPSRVNPFRQKQDAGPSGSSGRVIGDGQIVFDDLDVSSEPVGKNSKRENPKKPTGASRKGRNAKDSDEPKEEKQAKKSKQLTLFAKKDSKSETKTPSTDTLSAKMSFPEWFADQREEMEAEFPDLSGADLVKEGMKRFKERSSQKSTDSASEQPSGGTTKAAGKRKLEDCKENGLPESDRAKGYEKDGAVIKKPKPASDKIRFAQFANDESL